MPKHPYYFNSISSWSKYLSIIAPGWACIYDARVAYTLNVINYISGSKYQILPVPSGRNSKINLLDIETLLISAKFQDLYLNSPKEIKRKFFIGEGETYRFYINLMHDLHNELWEPGDPVQYTEMLLFAIADNYAYTDLLKFCINNGDPFVFDFR